MKKFSKMLTLGLALTMAFGMSVNVSASDVTSHVYGVSEDVPNQSVVTPDPGDNASVWYPEDFVYADVSVSEEVAESMAADIKASAKNAGQEIVDVVGSFSLTPPANWDKQPVVVQFTNVPSLSAGEGFVLYHFKDGKFVEEIAVTWNSTKKCYESTITNFSDFVLVKVKDNGTVKHTTNPYLYGGLPDGVTAPATTDGTPVSPKTGEM